jgi:hypothetical protein
MAYTGPITDPFKRLAPDGRTYFDILDPPRGIVALYRLTYAEITKRENFARAAATPVERVYWQGTALRLQNAIVKFERRLAALALRTATVADASIVRHIKSSQVRPDTGKAQHMHDNIRSRAIPTPGGLAELGLVGIADLAHLNRTTRGGHSGVYWEAPEFGTDAHVGRTVKGFFMPGRARPSQADFRVHPELQVTGRGPKVTIGRPIQERGFLRNGVEDAWRFHGRQFQTIKADLAREFRAVKATSQPRPTAVTTRSSARRRRP